MNKKIFKRLIIITAILAIIDVCCFSPGILSISIQDNPILFFIILIINAVIFGVEIRFLMTSTEAKYGYDLEKLRNSASYIEALETYQTRNTPFKAEIKRAIDCVKAIERKKDVLAELLDQNNKEYVTAFVEIGNETTTFIFNNTRKILNRILIFDEIEGHNSVSEHKDYINGILESNEKVLGQFNCFLTEVSQMDDNSETNYVTKVLSDMTTSLKLQRGQDEQFEKQYKNLEINNNNEKKE